MTGITQMVLTQAADPIVGTVGKLNNTNSLLFGSGAGATLISGDNLLMSSLTASTLPALGIQSFAIDYWVKFNNIQFDEGIVHQFGQAIIGSGSVLGGPAVVHVADGINFHNYLIVNARMTIPTQAIPGQIWQRNVWYHIAMSRNGVGQFTAWINGFRIPEILLTNTSNYNIAPTVVGSWRNTYGVGTTNNTIGSIYNLRLQLGTTYYNINNATINVPNNPYVADANTRLLLNSPTGNPYQDASGTTVLTNRATVNVLQSENTPYYDAPTLVGAKRNRSTPFTSNGSGSLYFTAKSNSYAYWTGSTGFAFGVDDFTIEWFAYHTDNNQFSTPWWLGTSANPTLGVSFEGIGAVCSIKVYVPGNNSYFLNNSILKSTFTRQWAHWALVRSSGVLYYYFNGTIMNGGGTPFTTSLNDSSSTFYIGRRGDTATNNDMFGGYISNIRISKKAVYTGNFTVPTFNLQRLQNANPFGGSNTTSLRTDQVPYLLVP